MDIQRKPDPGKGRRRMVYAAIGTAALLFVTLGLTQLKPAALSVQRSSVLIDEVKRAGRVKGRAEVLVHFRTMILPNGYTVTLPGAVDSAPDLDTGGVKGKDPDGEGKIQHQGEKGKDAGTIATTAGIGAGSAPPTGVKTSRLTHRPTPTWEWRKKA